MAAFFLYSFQVVTNIAQVIIEFPGVFLSRFSYFVNNWIHHFILPVILQASRFSIGKIETVVKGDWVGVLS